MKPPLYMLLIQLSYLIVLLLIGFLYVINQLPFFIPPYLSIIPVGVPWYGALGAIIISLSGIAFDHRNDWDSSWNFWHFIRPFIGATMAIIAFLIFQAGILGVGSSPTPIMVTPTPVMVTPTSVVPTPTSVGIIPTPVITPTASGAPSTPATSTPPIIPPYLLYYVIAFVVGYREATFRELIKRVADVIFTPGGGSPPPAISAIKPTSGTAAGGDTVTITGSGFTGTTSVKFNSTPATKFNIDSDSQITATTPPGAGTVSVTITTKSGSTSGGQFAYVPIVKSITQSSGPIGGGTSVTITGNGFTGATAVNFGTNAARSFTVDSDTQITAVSPAVANSGEVDVTVVTPGGTSTTGAADQFTYQ